MCVCIWRKSVTESTQQACGCVSDDDMMLHNQTSGDASYTVHFEWTVQIQPESDFCFGVWVFLNLCCFGLHLQNNGEPQLEKEEETERKRRRGHAKIRQRRHTRQMKNADNSRISGVSLISCRREVCTHWLSLRNSFTGFGVKKKRTAVYSVEKEK